jgi:hypothetical protein
MILETLIPPAQPASWYRKHTPCAFCESRVLYRKDDPPRLLVRHEKCCIGVLEASTKEGPR